MNVEIISKEEITKLLNDWYQAIISQRVLQSNKIKEGSQIKSIILRKTKQY